MCVCVRRTVYVCVYLLFEPLANVIEKLELENY